MIRQAKSLVSRAEKSKSKDDGYRDYIRAVKLHWNSVAELSNADQSKAHALYGSVNQLIAAHNKLGETRVFIGKNNAEAVTQGMRVIEVRIQSKTKYANEFISGALDAIRIRMPQRRATDRKPSKRKYVKSGKFSKKVGPKIKTRSANGKKKR